MTFDINQLQLLDRLMKEVGHTSITAALAELKQYKQAIAAGKKEFEGMTPEQQAAAAAQYGIKI